MAKAIATKTAGLPLTIFCTSVGRYFSNYDKTMQKVQARKINHF
jgi:hypothetical protein